MVFTRYRMLLLVLLSILLVSPGFAQPERNVTFLNDIYQFWDMGIDVATVDDMLLIATGRTGVHAVETNFEQEHESPFYIDTPGRAVEIAVQNNLIYVADETGGLRIVDYSDPGNVFELSFLDSDGPAGSVFVHGNLALLTCAQEGLMIASVGNPDAPIHSSTLPLNGIVFDVVADDTLAYITHEDGLKIVSINDPSQPFQVAELDLGGDTQKIEKSGDFLFISKFNSGYYVVDVSDPKSPSLDGSYTAQPLVSNLSLFGNTIVLSHGTISPGVSLVDITDPTAPSPVTFIDLETNILDAIVSGDELHALSITEGLVSSNIADPQNPVIRDAHDMVEKITRITYDGGAFAYACGGSEIMRILQVDQTQTIELDTYDVGETVYSVFKSDNILWMGTQSHVLAIDITSPLSPTEVGRFMTGGIVNGLESAGNFLYAACGSQGLRILDIHDLDNIFQSSILPTPGTAVEVSVSGSYAVIADYDEGVQIINIQDRENPNILGTFATNGFCLDAALYGVKVALADTEGRIWILDISNPRVPSYESHFISPGEPYSLVLEDRYLFVGAQEEGGLRILDIFDFENPVEMGYYDTEWYADGIAHTGVFTLVADWYNIGLFDCTESFADFHFQPVRPTSIHYLVQVNNAMLNAEALTAGSEIGVFDGGRCVGMGLVTGEWPVMIDTWGFDIDFVLSGFMDDNPIFFKYYLPGENREKEAVATYLAGHGDGFFANGPYAEVNLAAFDLVPVPQLELEVDTLQFSITELNEPVSMDLVLMNSGDATLEIDTLISSLDVFAIDPRGGLVIEPNQRDTVEVTFNPVDTGEYMAELAIYSNADENPVIIVTCIGEAVENSTDYFTPVEPTEIPYPIIINLASNEDDIPLEFGDEVGVYDDTLCVGAIVVTGDWPITLIAWEYDQWLDNPGFDRGDSISFRMWDKDIDTEYTGYATYFQGNGRFGDGPFASIQLETDEVSVDPFDILPTDFLVHSIYPNPFNSTFAVKIDLPISQSIRFTIFNSIGQTVFEDASYFNAGRISHSISFDGTGVNSGAYYLRVENEEQRVIRKLMYVK